MGKPTKPPTTAEPKPVVKLLTDAEPEFIDLGHGCRYFWPVLDDVIDLWGVGRFGLGLSVLFDGYGKAYHATVELMTVYDEGEAGMTISSTFGEVGYADRWTHSKTEFRFSTKSRDAFAAKALEQMRADLAAGNRQLRAMIKEVSKQCAKTAI
jgi:hypothetical protein